MFILKNRLVMLNINAESTVFLKQKVFLSTKAEKNEASHNIHHYLASFLGLSAVLAVTT